MVLPTSLGYRSGNPPILCPNRSRRLPQRCRVGGERSGNGGGDRGVFLHDLPEQRHEFGRALAQVTHRDERAIEGALFVAEVAASCAPSTNNVGRETYIDEARRVVTNRHLREAIDRSVDLACRGADLREAAQVCGASEVVVHTVPFATYCFLRYGDDPMRALAEAISAGGDTDSCGAMLGGWLGALHGEGVLPGDLIRRIHDGPFGPSHLRALTACLAQIREDEPCRVPSYSPSWVTGSGGSCPSEPCLRDSLKPFAEAFLMEPKWLEWARRLNALD